MTDIDILKQNDLFDLMDACFIPRAERQALEPALRKLQGEFKAERIDFDRNGVAGASEPARADLLSLVSAVRRYGIFVVPHGALEEWLPELGVTAPKPRWLPLVFEAMGSDPTHASYVRPAVGGVWDFLRDVARSIEDPDRLGIPA